MTLWNTVVMTWSRICFTTFGVSLFATMLFSTSFLVSSLTLWNTFVMTWSRIWLTTSVGSLLQSIEKWLAKIPYSYVRRKWHIKYIITMKIGLFWADIVSSYALCKESYKSVRCNLSLDNLLPRLPTGLSHTAAVKTLQTVT